MRRLVVVGLAVAFIGLAGAAAEKGGDPTGTWKWTVNFRGQSREMTARLKMDGSKLTGALVGNNGEETAIEDGSYRNGEVTFKVSRERDGRKMTMTYRGKLSGDTIKGKMSGGRGERDWVATRSKD